MKDMSGDTVYGEICIVDDSPDNLDFLGKVLRGRGYAVKAFPDGPMALKAMKRLAPDLIMLDIKMPDMDGFQLCRRIKREKTLKDIPVIFVSAVTDTREKLKAFQEGGVDYITKPFHVDEICSRAATHLSVRRCRVELEKKQATLQEEVRRRARVERALHGAHDKLEERVAQRTRELALANENLNREIDERKQAQKELETAYEEITLLKRKIEAENVYLREEIKHNLNFEEIIGQSDVLKHVLFKVEQVSPLDSTVLILGETGTGKELIARAIHHAGLRKSRPLVKVNCAALPATLIESELFGHEKGAFSGAHTGRQGRFELADKGTLFLDEVAEMPLDLQPKLLRVIQEGEFERLGSSRTRKVDVRIIAATNRNLEKRVQNRQFRDDLWYRLNVFPITVPPLRDRGDDIPLLVSHYVKKISQKTGKRIDSIAPGVMEALCAYAWPGNVRELGNVIERAIIASPGHRLQLAEAFSPGRRDTAADDCKPLAQAEKELILKALEKCLWRIEGKKGAALLLGLNPSTLRGRMRKYGIKRP